MESETKENELIKALVEASKNIKKPVFNKKVAYGKTNFKYADLNEIISCCKEALNNQGIVIIQRLSWEDDRAWIETKLIHISSHSISSKFPIDTKGLSMQQIGAQITYVKRYSLSSLLCLVADEDNDAKEIESVKLDLTDPCVNDSELYRLKQLASKVSIETVRILLKKANVSSLKEIKRKHYDSIVAILQQTIKEGENE